MPRAYIDLLDSFGQMKLALKHRKKFLVAYCSYPYTKPDPLVRTEEIKKKVRDLCVIRHDFLPIVPHLCFDALYDFPCGYTHEEFGRWEIEIIARCDVLLFDKANQSMGVRWEKAIASALSVPSITYIQFADGWKP